MKVYDKKTWHDSPAWNGLYNITQYRYGNEKTRDIVENKCD